MKLLFRQRAFSWFDSYDIYDENENTVHQHAGLQPDFLTKSCKKPAGAWTI